MTTLTIDIINPKAKKLLQNLSDLNLISIQKEKKGFAEVLQNFRSQKQVPTLGEITKEVETARAKRYGR